VPMTCIEPDERMAEVLRRTVPEAVLDDTMAVIDAHGGTIDFVVHTDVALARRPR
jgi:hypothetical protein